MRNMFVRKLHEHMSKNSDIVFVTGDLGFGALEPIMDDYPDRFINAGVSEQSMMSIAAGLAFEGKKVFVYSIGNFPSLRCLEQIRNDVLYHNLDVKIVSIGTGFAYGGLGMTHHATEDTAILKSLPNMNVLIPSDPMSVSESMDLMVQSKEAFYFKIGKTGEKVLPQINIPITKGRLRENGRKYCIVSTGSIIEEAIDAIEILKKVDIKPALYDFSMIKPFDTETIETISQEFDVIISLEEHNINGGLGTSIADVLASNGGKIPKLIKLGLQDTFSEVVGSQKYLRQIYKMSSSDIVDLIMNIEGKNV